MYEFKLAFRNYANFDGRSTRRDFWMYVLFYILVIFALNILNKIFNTLFLEMLIGLFQVVFIIPSLSIAVRRLHDVNKNGWFLLLSFIPLLNLYLFYLMLQSSHEVPNLWGNAS